MLTGCVPSAVEPPSLAPRAIEKAGEQPIQARSSVRPGSVPASVAARLNDLLREAREGDAAFRSIETREADDLRGVGAARGSESWALAQQAISALLAARQQSASALSDLDSLAVETVRDTAGDASRGGLTEIMAARAEAEAIVYRQNSLIDTLTR
jgi:hypothetical protein